MRPAQIGRVKTHTKSGLVQLVELSATEFNLLRYLLLNAAPSCPRRRSSTTSGVTSRMARAGSKAGDGF
jgi:hypothetical protein